MSTATELVKAEADEAEAAEGEDVTPEDDDDDAPPTEPPPAPPIDSVKLTKALDSEGDRHERAVQKIVGDDFEAFTRCPTCDGGPHGFVLPIEALPDDAQTAVRAASEAYLYPGNARLMDYAEAADMAMCDICKGEGLVRSGSKHPQHVLEVCNPCQGNGWKRHEIGAPAMGQGTPMYQPLALSPVQPPAPVPAAPLQMPSDFAGRPWGDPFYGQPVPTAPSVVG